MARDRETITVTYPLQKFSPQPYQTVEVGGLFYTTFIKEEEGETPEEAFDRAFDYLRLQVKKQFPQIMEDYFERVKEIG